MGGNNPLTISSLIKGWGLGGGNGNALAAYSLKMVEALEGMAAMPRWVSFLTNGCGADSGSGNVLTALKWAYGLGSCEVGCNAWMGKQLQQLWQTKMTGVGGVHIGNYRTGPWVVALVAIDRREKSQEQQSTGSNSGGTSSSGSSCYATWLREKTRRSNGGSIDINNTIDNNNTAVYHSERWQVVTANERKI